MNRRQIVLFSFLGVVVGLASFTAGERLPALAAKTKAPTALPQSMARPSSSGLELSPTDNIDLTNATILSIGSLGFDQVFDLLSIADAKLREKWARQLDGMPFGPQKRAAIVAYYKALAEIDPAAAVQLVLSCKDEPAREMAIRSVLSATSPSDMPVMARMLEQLPAEELRGHNDVVMCWWSMVDPVAAAHFLEENSPNIGPDSHYLLLRNWVQVDSIAAEAWVNTQHLDDRKFAGAIRGFVTGLLERDEPSAMEYLAVHGDEERFRPALPAAARTAFLKSPDEARNLIMRLHNPDAREAAVEQIADLYDSSWISEWKKSPEDIAKWLVTLPADVAGHKIGRVSRAWNKDDRAAFQGWLNQLPVETKDMVASDYCSELSMEQFPDAIIVGETITNDSLRERTLRNMLKESGRTRAEISEAIAPLSLTPQQREFLEKATPEE